MARRSGSSSPTGIFRFCTMASLTSAGTTCVNSPVRRDLSTAPVPGLWHMCSMTYCAATAMASCVVVATRSAPSSR
eukprot:6729824-Pyramimonas_sp.AAC.1